MTILVAKPPHKGKTIKWESKWAVKKDDKRKKKHARKEY